MAKRMEKIAYHEAGHAVAGCILGLHFSTLSIEPDQDSQGHCQFKGSAALDRFAELSYQASLRVSATERQRARAVVGPHITASLAGLAVDVRPLRQRMGEEAVTLARRSFRLTRSTLDRAALESVAERAGLKDVGLEHLADAVSEYLSDAGHDSRIARGMAAFVTADGVEAAAYLDELWQRAVDLIERHWTIVSRVAAVLLEQHHLDEEQVCTLCPNAPEPVAARASPADAQENRPNAARRSSGRMDTNISPSNRRIRYARAEV